MTIRCRLVLGALALMFTQASDSFAQAWQPDKHVELIVGSGPGAGQDRVIRLLALVMQKHSIVPGTLVTVNKPGGGGSVAFTYLNQAADKSHALAISVLSLVTNKISGATQVGHDDITPVTQLFTEYSTFFVPAGSPLKSAQDLLAHLRKDPAAYSISVTPGLGAANHIALMLPLRAAGVEIKKLRTVVFPGSPEAFAALLGGHVDVVVVSASNGVPHMKSSKIRALAVTAPNRLTGDMLSDIPTWREVGTDVVVGNWRGMIGARGMGAAQVAYWEEAFARAVATAEWKDYLVKASGEPQFMRSAESRKFLDGQYAQIRPLFVELGLAK